LAGRRLDVRDSSRVGAHWRKGRGAHWRKGGGRESTTSVVEAGAAVQTSAAVINALSDWSFHRFLPGLFIRRWKWYLLLCTAFVEFICASLS
jgi:hypothetical protein